MNNEGMCEFCFQVLSDLNTYKNMSTKKYSEEQVDNLAQIRQDLCKHKNNCLRKENCKAIELISMIDEDPDIRRKKGLI